MSLVLDTRVQFLPWLAKVDTIFKEYQMKSKLTELKTTSEYEDNNPMAVKIRETLDSIFAKMKTLDPASEEFTRLLNESSKLIGKLAL